MNDEKSVPPMIVNMLELPEMERGSGAFGAAFQNLTPSMVPRGGKLGINRMRLSKGRTTCPFHYHLREDEAFFVLSGRGVLRYGDALRELRPGDCVSCPAGTGIAHQIANPFDEDLIYLAIGLNDPHEVCEYPDTGKVMVRSLKRVGVFTKTEYMEGEPERPRMLELLETRKSG